jgi:hypothetical protein
MDAGYLRHEINPPPDSGTNRGIAEDVIAWSIEGGVIERAMPAGT